MTPDECTEWFLWAAATLGDMLEAQGCARANPFRFKYLLGGSA